MIENVTIAEDALPNKPSLESNYKSFNLKNYLIII